MSHHWKIFYQQKTIVHFSKHFENDREILDNCKSISNHIFEVRNFKCFLSNSSRATSKIRIHRSKELHMISQ
jgi:hypothetical protein